MEKIVLSSEMEVQFIIEDKKLEDSEIDNKEIELEDYLCRCEGKDWRHVTTD